MDFSTWRASWLAAHPNDTKAATLGELFAAEVVSEGEFDVFASEESFSKFKRLRQLFTNGLEILSLLGAAEKSSRTVVPAEEQERLRRVIQLVRALTFTASVTSPTDLWLTHHLLETYRNLGLLAELGSGANDAAELASKHKLDPRIADLDVHFLLSRGILRAAGNGKLFWNDTQFPQEIDASLAIEAATPSRNWTPLVQNILESRHLDLAESKAFDNWMIQYDRICELKAADADRGWLASPADIAAGLRVVPIVLALRTSSRFGEILQDKRLYVPQLNAVHFELLRHFFEKIGYADATGALTDLGERVLKRGPGPFGIVHAYTPYLDVRQAELTGQSVNRWIDRAANIAASQDANAKTFAAGLASLWRYQEKRGLKYNVFIEHALGQGEATRQHFAKLGENEYQYFGADLEDKAIERARGLQQRGHLPKNMRFIDSADIGKPELVIDAVRGAGFMTEGAVMIVGNGFHEVRKQTDAGLVEVMKKYRRAGILVIFTEETALEDDELVASAWNTYHAGFRYFHELSGQGLRRFDRPAKHGPRKLSWNEVATDAGFEVLSGYTSRTRSVFPTPISQMNPPISATYFCVPVAAD